MERETAKFYMSRSRSEPFNEAEYFMDHLGLKYVLGNGRYSMNYLGHPMLILQDHPLIIKEVLHPSSKRVGHRTARWAQLVFAVCSGLHTGQVEYRLDLPAQRSTESPSSTPDIESFLSLAV